MREKSSEIRQSKEGGERTVECSGGEAEEMNRYCLLDELIEEILSRVSYPALYKARLLSKRWHSRFSISPRDELRCTSTASFHNLVTSAAVKWPKYAPVSVVGKEVVGYNRSSSCWHKLAIHERVPLDVITDESSTWRPGFAGSLMCTVGRSDDKALQLRVTNTMTGDWNLLPSPPEDRDNLIMDFRFLRVGSQNYKILVHNLPCPQFQAHVYDSSESSKTWINLSNSTSTTAGIPGLSPLSEYTDAYIDGTFYCMNKDSDGGMIVWRFATDTGTWEQVLRSVEFGSGELPGGMFQFGERFIIVSLLRVDSPSQTGRKQSCLAAKVYELNFRTLKLIRISTSPPDLVIGLQTVNLVEGGQCIYFCDIPDQGPPSFTCYSLDDQRWSCLPPPPLQYKWEWGRFSAFEPGFNPFASP
ncbi:hypothetical protein R1flu_005000 [Riccia fluitans]|uniref:F-box domain-containing protein n=1 Tax=Riccia fluitans TaxID=41844 RepID=A0ABD1YRX5_9MARC